MKLPANWHNLRRAILRRDNYACVKCGGRQWLEVDHIQARHQGGDNMPENLQTLCRECHITKTKQDHGHAVIPELEEWNRFARAKGITKRKYINAEL